MHYCVFTFEQHCGLIWMRAESCWKVSPVQAASKHRVLGLSQMLQCLA